MILYKYSNLISLHFLKLLKISHKKLFYLSLPVLILLLFQCYELLRLVLILLLLIDLLSFLKNQVLILQLTFFHSFCISLQLFLQNEMRLHLLNHHDLRKLILHSLILILLLHLQYFQVQKYLQLLLDCQIKHDKIYNLLYKYLLIT